MTLSSQLRIGNLLHRNGEEVRVTAATLNYLAAIESNEDTIGHTWFYTPITITPEWLGRCGFVKHNKFVYYSTHGISVTVHEEPTVYQLSIGKGSFTSLGITNVLYIHQIQNFIFALTGTELEIKL